MFYLRGFIIFCGRRYSFRVLARWYRARLKKTLRGRDDVPLFSESLAPLCQNSRGGLELLRPGVFWSGIEPGNSKTFRCGRVYSLKFRRRAHLGTFEHAGRSKGGHESLGEGAAPPTNRALPAVHTAAARE